MAAPDTDWSSRYGAWCEEAENLANGAGGDPIVLLSVLRQLEQLHRSLQEGPFRASLPNDRQKLYALLQSIETSGGWPYIPRPPLKNLMERLEGAPG